MCEGIYRLSDFARIAAGFVLTAPLRDHGRCHLEVKLQAVDTASNPEGLVAAGI
jgi:hypothetical protein